MFHVDPIHVYPLSITKHPWYSIEKTVMSRVWRRCAEPNFEADGRCQSPPYAKFDYVELTPQKQKPRLAVEVQKAFSDVEAMENHQDLSF